MKTPVVNPSVFELAARAFSGWTDPQTGVRVLRLDVRGDRGESDVWQTPYQQSRCFIDGGRKVLLRTSSDAAWARLGGRTQVVLDLATGEQSLPFPAARQIIEVWDATQTALLVADGPEVTVELWDMRAGRTLASIATDGWRFGGASFLCDGRRALVSHFNGRPHGEPTDSHFHLLTPGEPSRVVLEATGFYCNHIQGCPTDPELYAYDRWPAPRRDDIEQVIHVASLDGSLHAPAKLDARAVRAGSMMGMRDHYLWTADGRRIVSYFNPEKDGGPTFTAGDSASFGADFNHFRFPWVLSALDWRTGEDLAAKYPPGRWGGHMGLTPDGRWIVCAGGPGFDCLYAIELEALRSGWNERPICAYPRTVSRGVNNEPFPYPFVLPDGSGVVFNAGWPGPEHGVYLAEWPASLRKD